MGNLRSSLTAIVILLAGTLLCAMPAGAQQKYTISKAPTTNGTYLQQAAIDVDDRLGHQVRVYEIRQDFPAKDLAFAGVAVKEAFSRGMSDYVNFRGPFTVYVSYALEYGNKVFSRSTGTSNLVTGADGKQVVRYVSVENFVGGTGRFKGMRGQVISSGERGIVAKTLTQQSSG